MTSFFKNGYMRVKDLCDYFIDFIFPREKLERQASALTENVLRQLPKSSPLQDRHTCALWDYKDPLVREVVWQIKFYENEVLASLVAKNLANFIQEHCSVDEAWLILPIPISKQRMKERGFNQTELIAKHVSANLDDKSFVYNSRIIQKEKETKHQTGESRKERLTNLRNSFRVTDYHEIEHKKIILIDDVTTTGATFSEATCTLKAAGAKEVLCFSLAH